MNSERRVPDATAVAITAKGCPRRRTTSCARCKSMATAPCATHPLWLSMGPMALGPCDGALARPAGPAFHTASA